MKRLFILCLLTATLTTTADELSFRHDVLPVLSKAGCNGGGCHGALAGKGGFRLSLNAYDPATDHYNITRELRGQSPSRSRRENDAPGLGPRRFRRRATL